MTTNTFIEKLGEILEVEAPLTEDSALAGTVPYDSIAVMSIIAVVAANFKIKVSGTGVAKASTVGALIDLIGRENFK